LANKYKRTGNASGESEDAEIDWDARCIVLPEVNAGRPLVNIRWINTTHSALAEKDAHEGGIPLGGPVLDGENQGIGEVLWWIGELQVAV